ncbi:hypothetical protein [Mucilaginibacter auburnensis]|uniref:Uncharacterized protein n=1 Tax=Mucilaginibacter auburnensis TaxID=1457233 RepID=A0A2H9VRP9_9SPHI|nr:hypothetical protein [Mucilaginibacter auburnensis]PJJ83507.1 hypothetical protein CLV57_0489 [Mucilaginibacter auburnensis]
MKKPLYYSIAFSALMAYQCSAFAQIGVGVQFDNTDVNYGGRLRSNFNDPNYLYNTWAKGSVLQGDGKSFNNLDLMFDRSKSRVLFKDADGSTKAFAVPIAQFSISSPESPFAAEKIFRRGFEPIDGATEATYYEVLTDGNIKLLKLTEMKRVFERAPGSLYETKQIKPAYNYYVAENNKLTKLRREKKFVINLLKEKVPNIEQVVAKLNLQHEEDLVKLFSSIN